MERDVRVAWNKTSKPSCSGFRFRHFRTVVKVISVLPSDRPTYWHRLHNLPCYLLAKLIYYSTIISAHPIDYRRWNEDVLYTLYPSLVFRYTRPPWLCKRTVCVCHVKYYTYTHVDLNDVTSRERSSDTRRVVNAAVLDSQFQTISMVN